MKTTFKNLFSLVLVTMLFVSCNTEELFVEPIKEVVEDDTDINAEDTEDIVEDTEDLTIGPCEFTLDNVEPNSTILINCIMDLQGQTINLPANVTILYEGGDIINGTLNFSEGGIIGGELLNASLKLNGASLQLKDTSFNFLPERWGIVEGETTSDIAQRNNDILEETMFKVRDLGGSTFKIDELDAYFEVSKVTSTNTNQNFYPELEAVNIPSDFNLEMTDNTILRVFPTVGVVAASLMGIADVSNVSIKGGTLYGDRDLRSYAKANEESGSHLLTIRSGVNVVIDGVNLTMGSVGGININSYGFNFQPDYKPTNNILIKNCIFDKIRMIALPITDGNNIIVENNQFIDTGQPTANSDGGVVGYAIDIEPVRKRDAITNEIVEYQKVHNVIIRNNIERGSLRGGFTIFIGQNITFEGNDMENNITYSFASDSKIINNTFTASSESKKRPAIVSGGSGDTVFNNEISGNTINGYGVGISPYYRDIKISNNTINECTIGIQLKDASDLQIHNNRISSSIQGSRGIMAHIAKVNNVNIFENDINVVANAFYFVQLNSEIAQEDFVLNVFNNDSKTNNATSIFSNSRNVEFKNNALKGRVQITNSRNIDAIGNDIVSSSGDGMNITGENFDINVLDNTIVPSSDNGSVCIRIAQTTSASEVNLSGNVCN